MDREKIKIFLFLTLLLPTLAYALETNLRDRVIEETLYVLETNIPRNQSGEINKKEASFLDKLEGFKESIKFNDGYLDFGARLGYITGYTDYDFDHHTSRLEFPFHNLMAGGSFDAGYKDLSFNSEVWGAITSDAGWRMEDKDWDSDGELISFTKSKADLKGFIVDGNLRYNFFKWSIPETIEPLALTKLDTVKIGVLVGYRYQRFSYAMYSINYPDYGITTHDGEKVLTYKIQYRLPYFGLAADISNDKFGLTMSAKYGFSSHVRDEDNHLLRELTFFGDYKKKANVFMANVIGFWRFYKDWELKLGVDVSLIRLAGTTWDATHDPAWDADQSTDTKQFICWSGLGYRF